MDTMIRNATRDDLEAITRIYNHAIINTVATFDTEVKSEEELEPWLEGHSERHPLLVLVRGDVVLGWVSVFPWSDRCAYDETAEISVYVDPDVQREGIGRKLLTEALVRCEAAGVHAVVARMAEGNDASLALFSRIGFEDVGFMPEVGLKFGKRLGVHIYQRLL
jgi:phosphinothricin acetyltransferase